MASSASALRTACTSPKPAAARSPNRARPSISRSGKRRSMAALKFIPVFCFAATAAFAQGGVGGGGRPAIPASLSGTEKSPVHIAGKVTLEDGSPPPFPAVIERLCNGVFAEGQTDAKGAFSLDLGHDII